MDRANDASSESYSDYDRMYEDDDDPELGSMEGHGSVIHHLLSQVSLIVVQNGRTREKDYKLIEFFACV